MARHLLIWLVLFGETDGGGATAPGDSSAESPPLIVDVEEERVKGCVKGARCVSLSSMKAAALASARL